jgi:hypothetical protein
MWLALCANTAVWSTLNITIQSAQLLNPNRPNQTHEYKWKGEKKVILERIELIGSKWVWKYLHGEVMNAPNQQPSGPVELQLHQLWLLDTCNHLTTIRPENNAFHFMLVSKENNRANEAWTTVWFTFETKS